MGVTSADLCPSRRRGGGSERPLVELTAVRTSAVGFGPFTHSGCVWLRVECVSLPEAWGGSGAKVRGHLLTQFPAGGRRRLFRFERFMKRGGRSTRPPAKYPRLVTPPVWWG